MVITQPLGQEAPGRSSAWKRFRLSPKKLGLWILVVSLLVNLYLVGLLRHTPGSYKQLSEGNSASVVGTVTKVSRGSFKIKTANEGTKQIKLTADTQYALFPKDYQTLIPVGLPSSNKDIVAGTTEANVSVREGYLSATKAIRVNLVRADVITGKVIEVSGNTIKFRGFAATGATDETRTLTGSVEILKFSPEGTFSPAKQEDVKKDMGLYAFVDKQANDPSGQITKLVVADFTSPTK